jgi:hypothetical protein
MRYPQPYVGSLVKCKKKMGHKGPGRVTLTMDARVVLDFQCVAGHRA